MGSTEGVLARLRRFARPMNPDLPAVEEALSDVRRWLKDAGGSFKLVGGVAVVHHGYARTTEDIDVLVEQGSLDALSASLASHGLERVSDRRVRHAATGVYVDLLVSGWPMPRAGSGAYPSPDTLGGSERDAGVVDLPGLIELKLRAHRHRDVADIVELLKRIDDARYTEVETRIARGLRADLVRLRRDALEELAEG